MREILFRGAQKVDCAKSLIWYKGSLIIEADGYTGEKEYYIQNENGSYLVIPETVGQYTGLTDKNGNKIFEGDIVKAPDGEIFKIEWHSVALSWILRNKKSSCLAYLRYLDMFEIIGNIHDNPELLKEAEQE